MQQNLDKQTIISDTRVWLERAVIGLNLCPFAKAVHVKEQIRYTVSEATDTDHLLRDLETELLLLQQSTPEDIDTTLLIAPLTLQDFLDYNDFLDIAEMQLDVFGLRGDIQIASFHPNYCFADSDIDDSANFTNRSPYPILHLLRESSIDRAVAAFPNAEQIYEHNIETMHKLGVEGWKSLFSREK
ncbi:DUF1415 domain-containing protein [uncultured Oxalicibacterium sp.]|uniref:DUF1415 domain-containing protein n=1 Tax=uncultured Oxalicibacterium sp. TaxID=1168540 RepID=UPI0025DE1944|nr:DUF1415 domain-containing protein [uncultured Oxalicibacterium sp.]